jgi:hypothetical protein
MRTLFPLRKHAGKPAIYCTPILLIPEGLPFILNVVVARTIGWIVGKEFGL